MTAISRERVSWGEMPDGTTLAFERIRLTGRPGPKVILVGGVHGDEHEAPLALLDLVRFLTTVPLAGTVTVIPAANGPALGAGTRTSPIDALNLARLFPGDPNGGPSQRLAAAIFREVLEHDVLVDGHSGGVELHFFPVAGYYGSGDGVSADTAERSLVFARATGLPNLWRLPATDGVLSLEAARRGLSVTGCEVGGRGHAGMESVETYRDAFLRILAFAGSIPVDLATPAHDLPRLLSGDWLLAPAAGLVRTLAITGVPVTAGTPLLSIESLTGADPVVIAAPQDGVVLATRSLSRVRAGDLAVLLAHVEDTP